MDDIRLSRVIDGMRLPLIYFVVIAHLLPFTLQKVSIPDTSNELYVLISELLSHHVAKISVRCFFLVSGYYFFQKYTGNIFQFGIYQWKRRFAILLVPFCAWNAIAISMIILKNIVFGLFGFTQDGEYHHILNSSIFQLLWTNPANFPLWYVRDLICMILIFPVIYYYVKVFKHYGILVLALLYLAVVESGIPGFSTTAIFFFSAGAYFSIFKKDLLFLFDKVKTQAILLTIGFLVLSLCANGEPNQEYLLRVFLITGVISFVNIFAYLEERDRLPKIFFGLSSLTFFIYVSHEIYIINFLKGFFYDLPIYKNGWVKIVFYFLIPLLCIAVCSSLFFLLQKCLPRITAIVLGRSKLRQPYVEEQISEVLKTSVG